MLTQIHICDLATIESLQLHLSHGCTMITGETGAGKSIFIEAIELALGGRSSPNMVRRGKEKADISLCFDITAFPHVAAYLKKLDLDQSYPECIIRRVITQDGRTRCYVNGSPVTLHLVKELGELLFHVHGQHAQQVLLKSDIQREMLDRFADHLSLVAHVKEIAQEFRSIDLQINTLSEKIAERATRSEFLHFQLEELQALGLKDTEWETLEAEHKRLLHVDDVLQQLQCALQHLTLDENQNSLSRLNEVRKTLESIQPYEPKTKDWVDAIGTVLIQLNDLVSDIESYLEKTELDPEKLQSIEARVSQIFTLSRKHKIAPDKLCEFKNMLAAELNALNTSDETLEKLKERKKSITQAYEQLADKLTIGRRHAAIKLEKIITQTIRSLSLPHGEFKIDFEQEMTPYSFHGKEKVVFLIKTNPDQALQPIAKVISGGELSRLSLAAHLALAKRTNIPTLIFDEVDTGLSGATAEKIGKLLQKLGESYQVFCVTHQAQVAACGHHHLLVEKYFIEKTTHTGLRLLDTKDKASEIARMIGGEKITQKTLAHAKEILGER